MIDFVDLPPFSRITLRVAIEIAVETFITQTCPCNILQYFTVVKNGNF